MKTVTTLLIAAVLIGCKPNLGRTIAQGDVMFPGKPEPYTVKIKDYDKKGTPRWIEWQPWELQNMYDVKVLTNDRIEAVWISKCDGDTLASATIYGDYGRKRIEQDILLDGSHYVLGSDPNERRVD